MKTLWQAYGDSVIGSTHIRKGMPNQDAYGYKNLGGDIQVLALSDGHGGEKHLYSDIGSKAAVEAAIECVEDYVNTNINSESDSVSLSAAKLRYDFEGEVSMAIQARWLQKIQAMSFFEDAIQFGCTLLLAVKCDDIFVFLQIGDGKIAVVYSDGVIYYPIPRDNRFVNNETASMAQPQAWAEMKVVTMSIEPAIHTVVLASDGVENAYPQDYYDDAYFYLNLALAHIRTDDLEGGLLEMLKKAEHYSKDDTTAVMWRNPEIDMQLSEVPEFLMIWMGAYPNRWLPIACYMDETLNKRIDYAMFCIEAVRRNEGYVPELLSLKQIYLDPETSQLEYFADGKIQPVDIRALHAMIAQMLMLPDTFDFLEFATDPKREGSEPESTIVSMRRLKNQLISLKRCLRYDYKDHKFVCDGKASVVSFTASNGNYALFYNSDLYLHQIMPLVGNYDCLIGHVIQHAKYKNVWGMVNLTQHVWQVFGGSGKQNNIEPGMTLTLLDGITVFIHGIPVKFRIITQ